MANPWNTKTVQANANRPIRCAKDRFDIGLPDAAWFWGKLKTLRILVLLQRLLVHMFGFDGSRRLRHRHQGPGRPHCGCARARRIVGETLEKLAQPVASAYAPDITAGLICRY
jgi:hypothetical protein